jgi:hypothetical protein
MPSRHRFLEPIHNVKDWRRNLRSFRDRSREISGLHSWKVAGGAYRDRTDDPLLAKQVLSQLS